VNKNYVKQNSNTLNYQQQCSIMVPRYNIIR